MIVQFDKEFAGRKVGELVNLNQVVIDELTAKGIVSIPVEMPEKKLAASTLKVPKPPVKRVKK